MVWGKLTDKLNRYREIYLVILVSIVALILRLPFVQLSFHNIDEGVNAVMAEVVLRGDVIYKDAWAQKPPLIYLIYAFVFFVFERNMLYVHLFTIFWVIMSALAVKAVAHRLFGWWAGFWGSIFYAVLSSTYLPGDMQASLSEIFMVLPLLLGFYFFIKAEEYHRPGHLWLAGLFTGLGTLIKQVGGVNLVAMEIYLFVIFWNSLRSLPLHMGSLIELPDEQDSHSSVSSWRSFGDAYSTPGTKAFSSFVRRSTLLISGFLSPFIPFILYFALTGALKDFVFLTLGYNFQYVAKAASRTFMDRAIDNTLAIIRPNFLLWATGLATAAYLLIGLCKGVRSKSEAQGREERRISAGLLMLLWLLFSALGVSAGGRFFGHYYQQIIPTLSVLAGYGFQVLFSRTGRARKYRSLGLLLVIFYLAWGIFSPLRQFGYLWPSVIEEYKVKRQASLQSGQEVAYYIRENSGQDDSIFIWGFYPQIYFWAERAPASRFINCNFLIGLFPGSPQVSSLDISSPIPGSWDLLMEDLRIGRPLYIVDTSLNGYAGYSRYPTRKFPGLDSFIRDNYYLDTIIDGFRIYQLKE